MKIKIVEKIMTRAGRTKSKNENNANKIMGGVPLSHGALVVIDVEWR
jgi:hypothetical protein